MKQIIKNKYDLHAILGLGIAFMVFFDSIESIVKYALPIIASLVIATLIEIVQFNSSEKSEYQIDASDILVTIGFTVIGVILHLLFPEIQSNLFGVYLVVLSITIWYLRFPKFRKLIVKYFALNYIGKKFTGLRAGVIILPLFIINGLVTAFYDFNLLVFFPLAIALYFGFVYFIGNPIKWNELDKSQKFQYGSWEYSEMSLEEQMEWNQIYNELNKK